MLPRQKMNIWGVMYDDRRGVVLYCMYVKYACMHGERGPSTLQNELGNTRIQRVSCAGGWVVVYHPVLPVGVLLRTCYVFCHLRCIYGGREKWGGGI